MRTFLFLQGNASRLFATLAGALDRRGHTVRRVNFCCADHVFWRSIASGTSFRGAVGEWPAFLSAYLARHAVTDIVLFGDCRPYHRPAVEMAATRGIAVHVFEEGYMRPNWITLERGGVNGFSTLPRTADAYIASSALLPQQQEAKIADSFAERVLFDLAFHAANALNVLIYPKFARHRPASPLQEAAGWIRRWRRSGREQTQRDLVAQRLQASPRPWFFFPLQLASDFQIRVHSAYAHMIDACEDVLSSFASHAPRDCLLVVKLHPLDNGLVDYRVDLSRLAERLGISDRLLFVDGGDLSGMIAGSQGVVTINSTVGLMAIRQGRPVRCLGRAIYDIPGLTFQDGLDAFWTDPPPPDRALVAAFSRYLVRHTQINGSYFGREGVEATVEGALGRMLSPGRREVASAPRVVPFRASTQRS